VRATTMMKQLDDRNNEARGLSPVPRIGLNADDAAKAIGVSKRQLFTIVNAGELPYVEAGPQTFLFDPKDLEAWLHKKKKTIASGDQHG
jgi:excisionase family DNA binding protein